MMLEIGVDVLEVPVGATVRNGRLRGLVRIAVDKHLIPYHGRESPYAKAAKRRATSHDSSDA